jgi:hypothetical protein
MSTLDLARPAAMPIKKASEYFGYTEKACRNRIQTGVWVLGKHYTKPSNGPIHLVLSEIENWQLDNGR